MGNAFGAWGLCVFQGVVDTEFLVLGKRKRMVGEHFDLLDIVQTLDKFTGAFQVLVVVADAGHEHVADPDGLADFVEVTEHVQVVIDGVARQFLVLCRVNNFEVNEQQVGGLHESFKFAEVGLVTNKVYARRVDAGVDACRLGKFEKFDEEIHLHQGFAAAYGDAAVFTPVALVAQRLFQEVFGGNVESIFALEVPGFGIVAEKAAHGAALREHDEAHSGAVHGAESFQFVDASEHIVIPFFPQS